jgi:hypothetical protein
MRRISTPARLGRSREQTSHRRRRAVLQVAAADVARAGWRRRRARQAHPNGEGFEWYSWWEDDCDTPLVVSFDGAPSEFAPATSASFALGACPSTDWPMAPWLALDSNRDGKITAADARWTELVLWSDLDDDRVGASTELRTLAETSLASIDPA